MRELSNERCEFVHFPNEKKVEEFGFGGCMSAAS